jgi:hypothetical protein
MQIIVDNVNLDNTTSRRMLGQIKNTEAGGQKTVLATFIITGDTATEFNQNWAAAQLAFNKKNPRVVLYCDDSATEHTEDISWLDGRHTEVNTSISWDPAYTQTGRSAVCTFTCTAIMTLPAPSAGGGSVANEFKGQEGSIKLVKVYSTGGIKTRIVEAIFQTTYNATAGGTFVITTVSSGTGGAAFTLTGTLPAFKVGQKIKVTGTTNYNGTHEIISISGQTVTVSKPFGSGETGLTASGTIGEATTGEENYTTAEPTLLTDYLLCDNDGSRNTTNGFVFAGKTIRAIDAEGGGVMATLTSTEMLQSDIDGAVPSVREFTCVTTIRKPDAYDPKGGAEPVIYVGKGRITVDRTQLGSTTLSSIYTSAASSIVAEVAAQAGLSAGALRVIGLAQALSRDGMFVEFEVQYTGANVTATSFNTTTQETDQQPIIAHRDSEGYHILQVPPGPPDGSVIKTCTRTGFGDLSLAAFIAPPVQSGFTFVRISTSKMKVKPKLTPAGEEIYEATWSSLFNRYRVRKGGTGSIGGASGSGGTFKNGYVTPSGPDI